MGTPRFTPDFKEEAFKQVTERGYSVQFRCCQHDGKLALAARLIDLLHPGQTHTQHIATKTTDWGAVGGRRRRPALVCQPAQESLDSIGA